MELDEVQETKALVSVSHNPTPLRKSPDFYSPSARIAFESLANADPLTYKEAMEYVDGSFW